MNMNTFIYEEFEPDAESLKKASENGFEIIGFNNGKAMGKKQDIDADIRIAIARKSMGLSVENGVTESQIRDYEKRQEENKAAELKAKTLKMSQEQIKKVMGTNRASFRPQIDIYDRMSRAEKMRYATMHHISFDELETMVEKIRKEEKAV